LTIAHRKAKRLDFAPDDRATNELHGALDLLDLVAGVRGKRALGADVVECASHDRPSMSSRLRSGRRRGRRRALVRVR
jgi:hypothetical protein